MISIIVPVYKTEKYLKNCIDSLLVQTYTDIEIILVDDGSPDACGAICDAYAQKDSRVKVIHQENGGLSSARNAGLAAAMGELIGFVDSDDTVEPDMYELMHTAIAGHDLAICASRRVREGEVPPPTASGTAATTVLDSDGLWQEIFGCLNNSACNKLYRAKLIKGCYFPSGLIHGEDLLFHLSYLPHIESGVMLEAVKYNYYIHSGSVTKQIAFSENAFDEVTVKDLAYVAVKKSCPAYTKKALYYCFTARMNVCRKLYRYGQDDAHTELIGSYRAFWKAHYGEIKALLPMHRRIEYALLIHAKWLYKLCLKGLGE